MVTLQEVKQLTETPEPGANVPSAKRLKDCGNVLLFRRMGRGAKLAVYREGYAVYEIGKNATVFPVAACGDYRYGEPGRDICIHSEVFDGLAWHIRLFLEGEDRICRNRESYEREKKISYRIGTGAADPGGSGKRPVKPADRTAADHHDSVLFPKKNTEGDL